MDEQEKEEILYRLDEKTDNLRENQREIRNDVRTNRKVFNSRLRKESKKIDDIEDVALTNRVRIAGLAFGVTTLLVIAAGNAGFLPI